MCGTSMGDTNFYRQGMYVFDGCDIAYGLKAEVERRIATDVLARSNRSSHKTKGGYCLETPTEFSKHCGVTVGSRLIFLDRSRRKIGAVQ